RSIRPTSPVPAEPVTCMCAAMTTPARTIQRFTASTSPLASCQVRTMETRCRSMSSTNDGNSLSLGTGTGAGSPLTEIYNSGQSTGTDWLFVGIPSNCAFSGASTGCVESFNITSGFPATAAAAGATSGGTSGIVVDNVSTSGHASSLYYSTLARQPAPAPAGRAAAADA